MPDQPQASLKPSDEKVRRAFEKAIKAFGQRPNVTGIDIGYKYDGGVRTEQVAVRVHVREKIPLAALEAAEVFPKEIDGVPIDVIEGIYTPGGAAPEPAGGAEPALEDLSFRRQRRDPIQPGISISNATGTAGTLGTIVYDRVTGGDCILSNWHVLAGSIFAQPGDAILQPGRFDGGRQDRDTVARLERMHLGRRGDAAIALLNGQRNVLRVLRDTEVIVTETRRAQLGDGVAKSGRTTGVTRGVVDGFGLYNLPYSVGQRQIEGFLIRPEDRDNPLDQEISAGGDSGSLWYDPASGAGLGLHMAGETQAGPANEYALACHLDAVLDELGVSLEPVAPGAPAPSPTPDPTAPGPSAPGPSDGGGGAPTLLDLLRNAGIGDEVLRRVPLAADQADLAARGIRVLAGRDGPVEIEIDPQRAGGRIRIRIEDDRAER